MLRKTLTSGLLALAVALTPEVEAKNFFQKAKEKLDQVTETLDGVSSSYSGLSGFDFNITKAYRDGTGVTVEYTMINNTGSEQPICISSSTNNKNTPSQAIGSDGTVYTVTPGKLGGKTATSGSTFPSGVLLKGTLKIENVPTSVTKFKSLVLGGYQYYPNKPIKDRYTYFQYAYSNYPITELGNTSGDNVRCTCPDLAVAYKGISRSGNTITLTITITSVNGDSDIGSYGATIYDDKGNTIERVGQTLGGQQWGAYSGKLPEGVPVKAVFTFNVSKSATKISLFKLSINPSPYVIEIRNITLPTAE